MQSLRLRLRLAMACLTVLLLALALCASANAQSFRFAVMMHVMQDGSDDTELRAVLEQAQAEEPAFIVVNGMRSSSEPCTDRLFRHRAAMLESASVPVIPSLAGSDWMDCRDRHGRPAPSVWLNLLRDQVYGDISWSGGKHLSLRRQSAIPAFRAYAENTRWVMDEVLFATLNVPANNNHYIASAGGNSEFEDRQIANRDWLRRLALQAKNEKRSLIVLFCDGNPLPAPARRNDQRDGYAELRPQLRNLAERSGAKVLVIQGPASEAPQVPTEIRWEKSLAFANLRSGLSSFEIDLSASAPVVLLSAER